MDAHVRALTLWVGAIIAELVAGGVSDFVVCPGSRSTPLALAVARHPGARVWMQLDERSGAFFALGMARQTGRPAALICTSGTAAANFLPAVAEADLSRVPLLVLTADRPPELRDNGAPQTIDQVGLFGPRARWFSDLPTPDAAPALLRYARSVIARAIAASMAAPAGPVHLNMPFREPLVPDRALLAELYEHEGRDVARGHVGSSNGLRRGADPQVATAADGQSADAVGSKEDIVAGPTVRAMAGARQLAGAAVASLAERLAAVERGLIMCGPDCPPGLAPAVAELAAALGYPILADPLSGVRCGPHDRGLVLSAYDAFLRDESFAARHAPALVLRFGAMPTAKPALLYLQRHPAARQIVVDEGAGWREPTSLAAEHLACDPVLLCGALVERLARAVTADDAQKVSEASGGELTLNGAETSRSVTRASGASAHPSERSERAPQRAQASAHPSERSERSPERAERALTRASAASAHPWAHSWLDADAAARGVIAEALGGRVEISEPGVFAELAALLPDGATLFVGNSMPVRDCDTFFPASGRRVAVMGNRGANGIDGLVSTALGAAVAGARPMVLVLGDISLYHDSNGLLAAKLHGLDATVVLINNDGGGIFSFLPQASEADRFELLFGTPHGLDFRPMAELYGARYTLAEGWEAFRAAVSAGIGGRGLHIVEVRTERGQNVADHRRIWPLVSAALGRAGLA